MPKMSAGRKRRLRGVGRGQVPVADPLARVAQQDLKDEFPHGEVVARALLELLWLV